MKAIPAEVGHFAEAHPLLVGAAVIALGIGYYEYNRSPSDRMNVDASAHGNYAIPSAMATAPVGGSTGLIETTTNPAGFPTPTPSPTPTPTPIGSSGDNSVSNLDLLNFEKIKEADSYSIATQTLNTQLAIALANAAIAEQGIQASNWQTSAQLAQAFLQSGYQFFGGTVGGQTFGFIGSGDVYSGKNMTQVMAQQAQQLSAFEASPLGQSILGGSNVVQPSTGTLSIAPYGSAGVPTSSYYPYGSTGIAPTLSGASSGSASSPTYNPSSYQATGSGFGGSGASGGTGYRAVSV